MMIEEVMRASSGNCCKTRCITLIRGRGDAGIVTSLINSIIVSQWIVVGVKLEPHVGRARVGRDGDEIFGFSIGYRVMGGNETGERRGPSSQQIMVPSKASQMEGRHFLHHG
jgi:hypothetical protein